MSRTLLVIALLASTAQADVWQRAIDRGSGDASRDRYEAALHEGDELAQRANAKGQTARTVTSLVDQAVRAYESAAAAMPQAGEPHFRIASLVESFFTDCNQRMFRLQGVRAPATCPPDASSPIDLVRAKQAVDAWDAFESRSPLDPRISEALFSRAILRTKLVNMGKDTRRHLEGALKDYTALLDRADGLTMLRLDQVWGNLAETYMMLGKLDDAIDAYQVAIDKGAGASTHYGKAVALDRDERSAEALDIIRRQRYEAFEDFREEINNGNVFYVPAGEEYYYFALIYEAFGYNTESIASWRQFMKSGAHPQYQARAKAHLDALLTKPPTTPRLRRANDPFVPYP